MSFRLAEPAAIARLLDEPDDITKFLFEQRDRSGTQYIDKAWHGIHYLLTGTADEGTPPLDFIMRGGDEIGGVDVGYGPARAFTNEELRDLARALQSMQSDTLRSRFDPARMKKLEIYPDMWDRDPEQDDVRRRI